MCYAPPFSCWPSKGAMPSSRVLRGAKAMPEFLRTFLHRLAALFRRGRLEGDLDEELRSHLEMAADRNLRKGMSAEDAPREAIRSFGAVEQANEKYRDHPGLPAIATPRHGLRFSVPH